MTHEEIGVHSSAYFYQFGTPCTSIESARVVSLLHFILFYLIGFKDKNCDGWAKRGECTKNPNLMSENDFALSCSKC